MRSLLALVLLHDFYMTLMADLVICIALMKRDWPILIAHAWSSYAVWYYAVLVGYSYKKQFCLQLNKQLMENCFIKLRCTPAVK